MTTIELALEKIGGTIFTRVYPVTSFFNSRVKNRGFLTRYCLPPFDNGFFISKYSFKKIEPPGPSDKNEFVISELSTNYVHYGN